MLMYLTESNGKRVTPSLFHIESFFFVLGSSYSLFLFGSAPLAPKKRSFAKRAEIKSEAVFSSPQIAGKGSSFWPE
jgi:hypothetical protein